MLCFDLNNILGAYQGIFGVFLIPPSHPSLQVSPKGSSPVWLAAEVSDVDKPRHRVQVTENDNYGDDDGDDDDDDCDGDSSGGDDILMSSLF